LIHHGNDHKEATEESPEFPNPNDSNCQSSTKSATSRPQRKRHVCIYCNESFADADLLAQHCRIHQKVKKKLLCSFCSQVFDDQEEYSHHQLAHIKERTCYSDQNFENPMSVASVMDCNVESSESYKQIVAPASKDNFAMQNAVLSEIVEAKDAMAVKIELEVKIEPVEEFTFVNSDINHDQLDQGWISNLHAVSADNDATLVTTDKVVSQPRDFVCPDCDQGFTTLNRLAVHSRRCHPHVCRDCKRTFKWLDELNVHRQVYFMKPCYRWSRCPKLAFSHQRSY